MVLAPFTPFLADELFQKLTGEESVHLLDWPETGHINELVVADMETVREYINSGLSLRAQNKLKVRQPLASVTVPKLSDFVNTEEILRDELNVKEVFVGSEFAIDMEVTPVLKREGIAREVVRIVQNTRKDAGLNVDDRINVSIQGEDEELQQSIVEHLGVIRDEVLGVTVITDGRLEGDGHVVETKVEGMSIVVKLAKV